VTEYKRKENAEEWLKNTIADTVTKSINGKNIWKDRLESESLSSTTNIFRKQRR
jgi:hypothetical protein